MKPLATTLTLATALLLAAACGNQKTSKEVSAESPVPTKPVASVDPVKRGEYLVTIGGCNDCHTPFKMGEKGAEPDMSLMLSGHPETLVLPEAPKPTGPWIWSGAGTNTAFAGPWGVTYTANLTPDQNTGLGIWTEEQFIQTLRTGRHWGVARQIMPPMPWQNYGRATDEDLKAIFAYLKSIKPIANHVPAYQPPPAS